MHGECLSFSRKCKAGLFLFYCMLDGCIRLYPVLSLGCARGKKCSRKADFWGLCSVFQQMRSCGSPGVLLYLLKMRANRCFLDFFFLISNQYRPGWVQQHLQLGPNTDQSCTPCSGAEAAVLGDPQCSHLITSRALKVPNAHSTELFIQRNNS